MAVVELYSRRRKAEQRSGQPDVYLYDQLPKPFRNQVIHIWRDRIGIEKADSWDVDDNDYDPHATEQWKTIHDIMARETGQLQLGDFGGVSDRCEGWFLVADTDHALDMIELTFRVIERTYNDEVANAAIKELNHRFREHDLAYQYENGNVIRLDNKYVHAEIIKPALSLIAAPPFQAANDDFMLAHKHYRDRNYKDCVVAAQRAFESTLKAICRARDWSFDSGDRASELITVCRNSGLFPTYLDKSFDTYVAMLKTGLSSVRNNAGGHGLEPDAKPVPEYIARYVLHLTAANIVLLVDAFHGGEQYAARLSSN